MQNIKMINSDNLYNILNEIQIIDIRKSYQYNGWDTDLSPGGNIPGSVVFSEDWLADGNVNPFDRARLNFELSRIGIDKNKKTVIYGDSNLSIETINKYITLGFTNLYVLKEGINSYYKSNYPLEKMKNYKVLVHPIWIKEKLEKNKDNILIIEVGNNKSEYIDCHIKGAIYTGTDILDIKGPRNSDDYKNIPIEEKHNLWNIPKDSDIKINLEKLGICKDKTVVVYASNRSSNLAAARFLTILLYSGVKDVRFLDGGKVYAKNFDIPMESGEEKNIRKSNFGKVDALKVFLSYEEELELVNNDKAAITSIRCWEEYIGIESGYPFIETVGEIQSAKFGYSGTSMADFRNPDNTMFSYKHIQDRWNKWGITKDKKVSFHCGTGYRASEAFIYAWALGWKDIYIYDGGWFQWQLYESSPKKEKGIPSFAPENEPNFTAGIPIINFNVLRNFS